LIGQLPRWLARAEGISGLEGATPSENYNMKDMFAKAGFRFSPPEDSVVTAFLDLRSMGHK